MKWSFHLKKAGELISSEIWIMVFSDIVVQWPCSGSSMKKTEKWIPSVNESITQINESINKSNNASDYVRPV